MTPPPDATGLIDSHCHLDYLARDGVLEEALAEARAAGLAGMLTIGTKISIDDVEKAEQIASAHSDVWRTVGLHPHNAAEAGADLERDLDALCGGDVVGIGETGLDYFYDSAPRAEQARSFETHLAVAARHDLPVVVHSRDAEDDTIAILRNFAGRARGVIHCFTGTQAMADAAWALGFHVSFSGVLTFPKAEALRAIAAAAPADRILVETDAPYLAPTPKRGKPCRPAYVAYTAAALAAARGEPLAAVAARTTANFRALFRKTAAA